MIFSKAQIQSLHEVVKEFSNERTMIMAIPGSIRNNGKDIPAVDTTIGHIPTNKTYRRMYRGIYSGYREWLKKEIDKIENR